MTNNSATFFLYKKSNSFFTYLHKYKAMKLALLPILGLAILSLLLNPITQTTFSSTDDDTLSITGNGKTAALALKAIEEDGKTEQVDDFELTAANVLQIEEDDDVDITNDVDFDKARTVDVNDNEKEIDIDDNGDVDFDDYPQGTYRLEVITENGDRKLFVGIVAIGPEDENDVKKIIEKTIVEIIIDIDCGKGYFEKNGECIKKEKPPSVCYFNPNHKDCKPVDGKCKEGFHFNYYDQCVPDGKCPSGYGRLDDDESGKCFEKEDIKTCPNGYIAHVSAECPKPYTPEPCEPGNVLYNGECLVEDYDCAVDSEDPRCAQQLPPCEEGTYDTERRVCTPLTPELTPTPEPCYPGEPETCPPPIVDPPCEPGYIDLGYGCGPIQRGEPFVAEPDCEAQPELCETPELTPPIDEIPNELGLTEIPTEEIPEEEVEEVPEEEIEEEEPEESTEEVEVEESEPEE